MTRPAIRPKPPAGRTPGRGGVRHRIVAEARRHFFAHGFRGVTMDDLADGLGMSKKTLYAYFAGKGALLEAVIDDKLGSAEGDFDRISSSPSTDFLASLHQFLSCMRRHSEELQPPFLRDMARESPELFNGVQARRRGLLQRHLGKLLARGRKAGMIRGDIAVDLMIEILVGATDSLINPQKLTQLNLPAKTGLSAIVTIFLHGVVTGGGGEA